MYMYIVACIAGDLGSGYYNTNIRPATNKHEHTTYFKFYLKKTMIIALK